MHRPFASLVALLLAPSAILAGPTVAVVVGPAAPKLERYAADETAALFKKLFTADATVTATIPGGTDPVVLVGSPSTNPAIRDAIGGAWPKLSDQGFVLRSVVRAGRSSLVVGGGSPSATLMAADELAHHFGVRAFLHGDVFPAEPPPLAFTGIDGTFEPAVRVRAWQVLGESPVGFAGWGLTDHTKLLRQLVKLKFNRVVVADVQHLLGDGQFPVTGDTPGRKAFRGAKEFANPEYGNTSADVARRITNAARDLGVAVGPADGPVTRIDLGGFLPKVPTTDLGAARKPGAGFLITADVPGDLTPAAYFLGRQAFDPKLTPEVAHRQLLEPIVGPMSADRVALGFSKIAAAHALVRQNDRTLDAMGRDVLTARIQPMGAPPSWWTDAGKLYGEGMNEMYRGIRATYHADARPVLLYYAKRCEFAVSYFTALEAARKAHQASGDAAVELWEKATEAIYNGMTALGDVARDPSDRGTIAALALFVYTPLREQLARADKAARGKD